MSTKQDVNIHPINQSPYLSLSSPCYNEYVDDHMMHGARVPRLSVVEVAVRALRSDSGPCQTCIRLELPLDQTVEAAGHRAARRPEAGKRKEQEEECPLLKFLSTQTPAPLTRSPSP